MSASALEIELARHQWEDGARRLERAGSDPALARVLAAQVDVVSAELARRIGQVFTLAELVGVYRGADRWSLSLLGDALPEDAPPPTHVSAVADAAFARYARRAADYAP